MYIFLPPELGQEVSRVGPGMLYREIHAARFFDNRSNPNDPALTSSSSFRRFKAHRKLTKKI